MPRFTLATLALAACTRPAEVPGDATMGDGGRSAAAGAEGSPWRATQVCPPGAITPGIDVSYWQGTIDWVSVATEVDFAFIRVSDGLYYFDTKFATNWAEAQANGVTRGAYQFFRPSLDPIAQADLLLSTMGPLEPGDLPPVIDVETDDGLDAATVNAAIQDWLDRVEGELGVAPIIYTSWGLWSSITGDTAQFARYPLWAANWDVTCPSVPDAWGTWDFWQHSDSGSVAGIAGNVDENWFNGDLDDLLDYTDIEPPVPCEPVPAEGRIIEETETCFEAGGDPRWWYDLAAGSGGSLIYTHTTDSDFVDNFGVWSFEIEQEGDYRVEVYTAAPHAQSTQAAYQVMHALGSDLVVIDQRAVDGWNPLGTFSFAAGPGAFVRLDDNTGEPWNEGETQLVFDAVRLLPAPAGTTPTDPEPTLPEDPEDPQGPEDTGTAGLDDELPATADRELISMGCGCAELQVRTGLLPLALAALALVRRRREPGG